MNRRLLPALLVLALTPAAAQTTIKIGTVHLQSALLKTREGQAADRELRAKAEKKELELRKLQTEINGLREQLDKSAAVSTPEKQEALSARIRQLTTTFNRQMEDSQAEIAQEQSRIGDDLGGRMMTILNQYAESAGFALILDVSASATPVLYGAATLDVTAELVKRFDEAAARKPADASRPPK